MEIFARCQAIFGSPAAAAALRDQKFLKTNFAAAVSAD
jgi:hypothetical protein